MKYIFISLLLGIILGMVFKKLPVQRITAPGLQVILFLLLFLMGIQLGQNKEVWKSLGGVGIITLIITFASMLGSILALKLLDFILKKK